MLDMERRDFIALGGSAAVLLAAKVRRARAQQPAMPVIGYLDPRSPAKLRDRFARISPWPEGDRLCRGRERGNRVPVGEGRYRAAARASGRFGSSERSP